MELEASLARPSHSILLRPVVPVRVFALGTVLRPSCELQTPVVFAFLTAQRSSDFVGPQHYYMSRLSIRQEMRKFMTRPLVVVNFSDMRSPFTSGSRRSTPTATADSIDRLATRTDLSEVRKLRPHTVSTPLQKMARLREIDTEDARKPRHMLHHQPAKGNSSSMI